MAELVYIDHLPCSWADCPAAATRRLVLHGRARTGDKYGVIEAGLHGATFCQHHSNRYRSRANRDDILARWERYLDGLTPPDQSLVRGSLKFVERELI